MFKTKNSNHSIFVLSLLFIEFISNFLRANYLPNLGLYFRSIVLIFIIIDFLLCFSLDIFNGVKISKALSTAIVFLIYTLFVYLWSTEEINFFNTINLTTWVAVLYIFYHYGFPKSIRLFNSVVGIFSSVFIVLYYKYALNNGFVGNKAGVVNAVYYLVLIIPFLLIWKNKIIKMAFISVISIISIQSNKTTAILIIIFSLLICCTLSKNAVKKNFLIFIICCATFLVALSLFIKFAGYNVNEIISSDISGGGNGRIDIWETLFSSYKRGVFFQKLFGYGMNYSVKITGFSAHCDFFEVIISFGIIGFLIFISWFTYVGKQILLRMYKQKYFYIALIAFVQMLIMFMFSTSLFVSNYFLMLSAFIGMVFSYFENSAGEGNQ